MNSGEVLPAAVLKRKAVVYVRQSTQSQVQMNLESQRRQYDLVGEARRRGFDAHRRPAHRPGRSDRQHPAAVDGPGLPSGHEARARARDLDRDHVQLRHEAV